MAKILVRVVDVLRHLEVPFTAPGSRVVEGMADALQLVLIGQVMSDATQSVDQLVVLALENRLRESQLGQLLPGIQMTVKKLSQVPLGYFLGDEIEAALILGLLFRLMNHVRDPRADRFHQHLGAFLLQKLEHVEVPIALGGLGPEFARDLDRRFYPCAVDRDGIEAIANFVKSGCVIVTIELIEKLAEQSGGPGKRSLADEFSELAFQSVGALAPHYFLQQVQAFVEHPVRLTRIHFVGPDLIRNVVDDVPDIHGVEDAQEEVQVHFQAGFRLGLIQASTLLEKQDTEAVKAGVAQSQSILSLVHPKPARTASTGSEEDVAIDYLLLRHAVLFQVLQILDQIAHGEVRRITLAVVSVFFAELERFLVGHR